MLAGCLELLPARPSPTIIPKQGLPILIKWEHAPLGGSVCSKASPLGPRPVLCPQTDS